MAVVAPDITLSEPQGVGVVTTVDLSVYITACPTGIPSYGTSGLVNVEIISLSIDGVVQFKPLADGAFSFTYTVTCEDESSDSGVLSGIAEATIVSLEPIVSPQSGIINFPVCCSDCFNPIIVTDLYEGDTYIPFSLDMEDGVVVSTLSGDTGTVLNGVGVVELSTALVAGASIQLRVDSETCKAVSSVVKVKAVSEDCDTCVNPNTCHIRILSVAVKYDGVNLVSISNLSVEAFGELRYRLDNGEWYSDWASIGSFNSLVNHTLGIKLVNNPSCRLEYPFLAIAFT